MWKRSSMPPGLVALTLLHALILGGHPPPAPAQQKPIRVGEINSYSGRATVYTLPYKEGITMAVKEINDAGGVLGQPLEFVFRDDEFRPDVAVKMADELIVHERVDFLAGCISSEVGLALSAFAKEHRVLFFATHCQTSQLTWEEGHAYVAHTTSNTNQYARGLAKLAAAYQYKKWAHISPRYEYGSNLWEEFWSHLRELKPDVELVQQNWPDLGQRNHSSSIAALLQSGAEAVFSGLWGAQEIAFVKQAKSAGLLRKVRLFAPGVGNPEELDALGNDAPVGAITAGFAWYDRGIQKRHPALRDWVKHYRHWSNGQASRLGAYWGYGSVYVIAEAIKRAGSTDPEKVIGVLSEGFEIELPAGKVILRGCDQQAISPYWLGVVKMSPRGVPIMANVHEFHGKDVVRTCEEVLQRRTLAQHWAVQYPQ